MFGFERRRRALAEAELKRLERKARHKRLLQDVRDWFPVGSSFAYLGIECIAVSHYKYLMNGLAVAPIACLRFHYLDGSGQIKEQTLDYPQARALAERLGRVEEDDTEGD